MKINCKSRKEYVQALTRLDPDLEMTQQLTKEFRLLVKSRHELKFDQRRESVKQSELNELKSFAKGLMSDEAAVREALRSKWSNGQIEGQINRLKMVKRQMFGRGKLDLLRARVLHAA